MADKLRCGVIGVGSTGLQHLLSLQACPRAVAVAIAETNAQRAKDTCDRFKLPRSYNDYRELLDQPDVEAVIISVPNYLHAQIAIEALKARKHVFLEQPMAISSKDATKIVEAAKKTRCTFMVGQNFRFNRYTQLARQVIERGELGEIYHARAFWLRRSNIPRIGSWFTQEQFAGGGCTYDLGSHFLDLAMHLMKDFEAESVSAQLFSKFGARGLGEGDWGKSEVNPQKPFDVEDCSVALIKFKSGRTVALEASWAGFLPPDAREQGLDLMGTEGGLSLFPARLFRNGSAGYEAVHLHLNGAKLPHGEDRVHHFVTCVLDGKKPLVALDESLKLQQILDAIYTSAETGREVRLKA